MANETVTAQETTVENSTVAPVQETVTDSSNTIELLGKDIYSISFAESGIPYKNGQRKEKGKTFTRYTRGNIAFSIPDEHPFNQDFANGQVKSVILTKGSTELERVNDEGESTTVTVNTLNFASYINKSQWATLRNEELEDAKSEFAIARFRKLKSEPVSAEFLNALMGASVHTQE